MTDASATYPLKRCSKCSARIDVEEDRRVCWFCIEPMCFDCWDEYGQCGHDEARAIERSMRYLPVEQRKRMLRIIFMDELSEGDEDAAEDLPSGALA